MIAILLAWAVAALTVLSCVTDVRTMRIPNWHSLFIIAAFAIAFFSSPSSFGPWWAHLGAFALMFAVTFGLFCAGMFGSGDTKLGSSLALWIGLKGLVIYLFYMCVAGGVLAAMALWFMKKKPFKNPPEGSWAAIVQGGKSAVPYGVAISIGAWGAFFHTGLFSHQLH